MVKDYWVKNISMKKGTLHRLLGIPKSRKLPASLLEKIMSARVNSKITYNGRKISVTPLLKKRVNLALNLKKMKKR
jgi:hypothetical protein